MIKSADCHKKFHSAKVRFIEGALNNFLKRELPKVLGPILRSKLIEELLKLLKDLLPLKEHVKPGQIVWNAVSINTRADWSNVRFVPVTLTMINEKDIEQLARGVTMSQIAKQGIQAGHPSRIFIHARVGAELVTQVDDFNPNGDSGLT